MTMWPDSPETEELLNQVRQGQPAALDRLLSRHREPMRRMIDIRLDPAIAARVDASDIVQEVFLEASRRLNEYLRDPGMPFHLWLRHIARDHIIDAHRRHRQAQRRTVDREQPVQSPLADRSSMNLIAELVDRELTPATAAIRHEMEKRFHEAIGRLNADDREIILMRHFEQLSNQETATALALTEAAASMRYLRALRRLRACLAPSDA
jgi:RNA polymerase sigma-70 factor (ECF subfamily)